MPPDEQMMRKDDADHYIAREVIKQRMGDLERKISENNTHFLNSMAEFKVQISHQTDLLERQSESFRKSSESLRSEIEKDFASKNELALMAAKFDASHSSLNQKIDSQWSKLTIIVGTITAAGMVGQWLLSFSKAYH